MIRINLYGGLIPGEIGWLMQKLIESEFMSIPQWARPTYIHYYIFGSLLLPNQVRIFDKTGKFLYIKTIHDR